MGSRREDPIAAPPDCPQHFRFGVVVGRAARLVDAAVRHERQEAAAGRER